MRIFISIFLLFNACLSSLVLKADDMDTSYRLFGGIGIGLSFHEGAFGGIPTIQSCCAQYPNVQGSMAETTFGFRMPNALQKGRITFQGAASLTFNYLTAPFSTETFVGNFISGNTVKPAMIDFSLNMSGLLIGIEPRLSMHYSDFPISVFAGINASTFVMNHAVQSEQVIEPSDAFFKNGTRIQNNYDGAITQTRSIALSATLGVEYSYQFNDHIAIHPSLAYRTFLQSFIENHPWRMDGIVLGCGISYVVPTAKQSPPPSPKEKEPEIVLAMHFHAMLNDGMLEFGDTIPFPYERIIDITSTSIAPVYLFEKGSASEVKEQSHNEVTLAHAIKHINTPIRIIAFESDNEPKNTALKRAETIKQRLLVNGADRSFDIQTRTVRTNGLRYPELLDEARMVMVSFADGTLPNHVIRDTQYVFQSTSLRFLSEPSITGANIAGMVTLGTSKTMTIEEPDITFQLSPHPTYPLETQKLIAQSFATLEPNLRTKGRIELYARPILLREKQKESMQSESNTEFILGYSDFDKSDFTWIDQTVINRVVDAGKSGKPIILTPLIDDLGSTDHNSPLAEKRLQSAYALLSSVVSKDVLSSVKTASARTYNAGGGSLGRVLHRGIAVTIGK
ncbi:MAG: hypothetical protein FJ212_08195 [Ignavibacteria bacterium]|nr:hypothetical protein [Ignavibacteria bacterium]